MSTVPPRLQADLAGKYEIDREIGVGGSAVVYLAKDLRHDRLVALKVIHPKISATVGLERFLREIRIAANLQHPNILPLLDSGEADGLPYFATPYVDGASLRELLGQEPHLPFEEVWRITGEIAAGLTYAHERGIVHRDVKPGNVLLSDGHAILADFGLASATEADTAESLTGSDGIGGTVHYMSPEQVHGSTELDARTDIYSLACITYEMLCGEPPFTGRTAWAVVARQMSQPAESLRITRPDVPLETDAVIARALSKDPKGRFDSAADFAHALEASFSAEAKHRGHGKTVISRAAGIVLAVAAAISLFSWFGGAGDVPALDAQSVIVFPLLDDRGEDRVEGAGERVAIMIGAALDHAEPLRWIDGWDWLDPAVRTDLTGWSIQQGVSIARERGAAYVIDGRIMVQNDSVHLLLRLHEATNGTLIERSIVSAPAGTTGLPELGRRAVTTLLPSLISPDRPAPTTSLRDFEPLAVAAWLQGEREYRRSDFERALTFFQAAVASDSTMALAAMRGAQAASWSLQPQIAVELIETALGHAVSLTRKQRLLASGLRSYYQGASDTAVAQLNEALSIDRDWGDASMALGEVYYHLLPASESNLITSEAAFQDARRLDPGFTPPLVHLAELALRRGDVAKGDSLTAVLELTNDGVVTAAYLKLMSRCMGPGRGDLLWEREVEQSALAVLGAAVHTGVMGADLACALEAFGALSEYGEEAYAWSALVGLQSSYLAAGLPDEARRVISAAGQFEKQQKYLFAAGALAGAPFSAEAEASVRSLEVEEGERSQTQIWAIGAWQAMEGRSERVIWALGEAERLASSEEGRTPSDSLLVDVLSAWVALVQADTATAIDRFAALTPVAPPSELEWGIWQSLGAERLMLARLWLARGEYENALRVAEYIDHAQPVIYIAYLPESLRVRVQAAEALGHGSEAAEYRRRQDQLRQVAIRGGSRPAR